MSDSLRSCGSCTACCTALGVPELGKSTYRRCTHLCDNGCGIYTERPGSCRTFECQWLRGLLELDDGIDMDLRPDACGVIFDYQPGSAFGELYTAWEMTAGASAAGPAGQVVEELAEHFLVLVVTPPEVGEDGPGWRGFLGPPELVRQAREAMRGRGARPETG